MKLHRSLVIKCAVAMSLALVAGTNSVQAKQTINPAYPVLVVRNVGGFIAPNSQFAYPARLTVYSNGTVLFRGTDGLVYPGPAAATVLRRLVPNDVSRIINGAIQAHVTDSKFDWGSPAVADVPSTVIVLRQSRGAAASRIVIDALDMDMGLTKQQVAARKVLRTYLNAIEMGLGPYITSHAHPQTWKSGRWAYIEMPGSKVTSTVTRRWFGKTLVNDGECKLMTKTENEQLLQLLPKLNSASRWTSGGKTWQVSLRPLLPHERSCRDIGY